MPPYVQHINFSCVMRWAHKFTRSLLCPLVLTPVLALLGVQENSIMDYVDHLQRAHSAQTSVSVQQTVAMLQRFGLILNFQQSALELTQRFDYFGTNSGHFVQGLSSTGKNS